MEAITEYIRNNSEKEINPSMLAYVASLTEVSKASPTTAASIVKELSDQRSHLKMIASENYCSLTTQLTMGNLLTDKYAEGIPMHRFYAGCDNIDSIEAEACKEACDLFGAEHAYVQPHSGADANLIAYWAILSARVQAPALEKLGVKNPSKLSNEDWNEIRKMNGNQKLLGMDYYSGGHLTHGYRHNVSAQMFEAFNYGVDPETGLIDYDKLEKQAKEIKPLILLAGYSAYPRKVDFKRMKEIAESVGAVFMVDMAHFAGLVAGKAFSDDYDPVKHADIVTTTTHKTLRGPRGGMILCKKEFAEYVDKGCPMVIGGPLAHVMAAKLVTLKEANTPEFREYAERVIENASTLASACVDKGMRIATGGTDNHLFLLDVRPQGLTGRQAESALRECGITLNRNSLPADPNGPWYTSGLRFGTAALTSLGMDKKDMEKIASVIEKVIKNMKPSIIESGKNKGKQSRAKYTIDQNIIEEAKKEVKEIMEAKPLYPELDLEFLEKHFG